MLYTKLQSQSFLASEEEDFKCVYHIWAWWPSYLLEQTVSTPSTEGPMWNLVNIGPVVSEEKTNKEYLILYMYVAQRQGLITP